tara:strand:+ start:334 stop:483 length:150 start_codon:yes stop_codon:yes gene_type:complete
MTKDSNTEYDLTPGRREEESYVEYRMRIKLEKEIIKNYLKGRAKGSNGK